MASYINEIPPLPQPYPPQTLPPSSPGISQPIATTLSLDQHLKLSRFFGVLGA